MGLGPATTTDLQNRSLDTLTETQVTVGGFKLDDAYVQIITSIPSVVTRLAADPPDAVFTALVVQIQCAAVLRYLKNPDGKFAETADDYSFQRDKALASGETYITPDELAQLADTAGSLNSFSITPAGNPPDYSPNGIPFGYWS